MINYLPTIITFIFLIIIISYYVLLFVKTKKPRIKQKFKSITVIIPAHNEEPYIEACIKSVLTAKFSGKKEIIVVDDGSKDRTFEIVKSFKKVKLIRTKHSGKSASLNRALKLSKSELVAVVDADSIVQIDAIQNMAIELGRDNVAGATCIVKVKNRRYVNIWVHLEQIYNSLMRFLLSKIHANVVTPGPLSMYRRVDLEKIRGFSTEGFSEDVDVTIRLIRSGKKIIFSEKSIAETNMPLDLKGFLRQRTRFARGLINVLKRHMQVNKTIIDLYTLPILLFTYFQSVIMGVFILYQLISGYNQYFYSQGIIFNLNVFIFFFDWFSIFGFIKWFYRIMIGQDPLTFVAFIGIISTFLSYPLYFISIFKFDKKIDFLHIFAIMFMFPFWFLLMIIYILMLPEYFRKKQYNIWKKNE